MSDLIERGAAWLDDQRHKHLTRPVTYRRGVESVELLATVGQTTFEQADEYGALQRVVARDFLVRAADLVFGGFAVLPRPGDRIHETVDGQVFIYEVMAPAGEPPWRYSGVHPRALRIHTKQVGTEAAS